MSPIFDAFAKLIARFFMAVCVTAFLVMLAALGLQIVSRHVVQMPVLWASEVSQIAFNIVVFFGGLGALAKGMLISMTSVVAAMPSRFSGAVRLANTILLFAVALYLTPTVWEVVRTAGRFDLSMTGLPLSVLYIPGALFLTLVPLVLIFLHFSRQHGQD